MLQNGGIKMKRYAEFAAIAQEQIEEAMKQEGVLDARFFHGLELVGGV